MPFVHSNFRSLFVVDKIQINHFKRELFSLDYFSSLFTLLGNGIHRLHDLTSFLKTLVKGRAAV